MQNGRMAGREDRRKGMNNGNAGVQDGRKVHFKDTIPKTGKGYSQK